ncbi:MAG: helix-turn-helix domain-containing protein [Dorea sp.]|nr:helix-turn-helix domain-containing protein [Dorea sp.]
MLSQIAGSCRFLWNRMLADVQTWYEIKEKFSIPTPASYKKISGLEWLKGMVWVNLSIRLSE